MLINDMLLACWSSVARMLLALHVQHTSVLYLYTLSLAYMCNSHICCVCTNSHIDAYSKRVYAGTRIHYAYKSMHVCAGPVTQGQ